MLNRWIGILSILCMLSANFALVWHDFLPVWLADAPPSTDAEMLRSGERRAVQYGIFGAAGGRLGTSWTVSDRYGDTVHVWSVTAIDTNFLRISSRSGQIVSEIRLRYERGEPDSLDIAVRGLGFPMRLRGEDFSGDFACDWQFGEERGKLLLKQDALAGLRDAIRPFDRMPGLYVGRTWQIELFNPLAGVLPGLAGGSSTMGTMLVEVTGKETIDHPRTGAPVEVFVVEAPQARAWVAEDGRVLRQEVDMPVVGTLSLRDEPYEEQAHNAAAHPSWMRQDGEPNQP